MNPPSGASQCSIWSTHKFPPTGNRVQCHSQGTTKAVLKLLPIHQSIRNLTDSVDQKKPTEQHNIKSVTETYHAGLVRIA